VQGKLKTESGLRWDSSRWQSTISPRCSWKLSGGKAV